MSDSIVTTRIRATSTESKGKSDAGVGAYAPRFVRVEALRQEDAFFDVSPAMAGGDDYLNKSAERKKSAATRAR